MEEGRREGRRRGGGKEGRRGGRKEVKRGGRNFGHLPKCQEPPVSATKTGASYSTYLGHSGVVESKVEVDDCS